MNLQPSKILKQIFHPIFQNVHNIWLSNNFNGTDPDTLDYAFDDAENALFNNNYQLKIGTSTYQLGENGLTDMSGGLIANSVTGIDCFTNRKTKQPFPNGNTRFDLKVAIHSTLVRSSVKGKVVSFKLKNGKWKRARTDLAISIAGEIYDRQCSPFTNLSLSNPTTGFKKRDQLKEFRRGVGVTFRTRTQELGSRFDTPTGFGSLILQ